MRPLVMLSKRLLPIVAIAALLSMNAVQGYVTGGHNWGTNSVRYYVNPQSKWVSQNAAVSAVQAAAAAWHDQSSANVQLLYAGTTAGSSLTLNYKNEVFFRDGSNGGLVGETYYWWDGTGHLIDADMVFYEGTYSFFAGSGCTNTGIYIEDVAVHEFGHALGLGHSTVPGATMQATMPGYCDTTQLTLETDDIAGVESLYPASTTPPPPAPNTTPVVSISAPSTNATYVEGSATTFSGSASDTEDGNLTSSLKWTSNLSGQIGTGGSFSRALSAGVHIITASVTDRGGLVSSQQVTVSVSAAAVTPTLAAKARKAGSLWNINLTFRGFTSPTVDIYRNQALVGATANDGAATDPVTVRGTYAYAVCATGTSVCSNTVTVKF